MFLNGQMDKSIQMKNYYCLIAGLPELHIEDNKSKTDLTAFKKELQTALSREDYNLIKLHFRHYDNLNLLSYLRDKEAKLNLLGNLTTEDFQKIIRQIKEEELSPATDCPGYMKTFIISRLQDKPYLPELSEEDQLTTLYYDEAVQCSNRFVSRWFLFNLTIQNILTAVNCRKYGWPIEASIVGTHEEAKLIRENRSSDFGLSGIFAELDEVLRLSEEADFHERERKIDQLRWKWLDENSFFNYFSVEKIITFLIQSEIIARWSGLNQEAGEQKFRKIIGELQHSFEFPEEFKLNI